MQILHRHLIEHVPISDLCEGYGLKPNLVYRWQKNLFENATQVFENPHKKRNEDTFDERIEALQQKLAQKDSIIIQLVEDYVQLRKRLGET